MEAQQYCDSKNNKMFLVCKNLFYFIQKITTTFLHLSTSQFSTKARQRGGKEGRREEIPNVMEGKIHKT